MVSESDDGVGVDDDDVVVSDDDVRGDDVGSDDDVVGVSRGIQVVPAAPIWCNSALPGNHDVRGFIHNTA